MIRHMITPLTQPDDTNLMSLTIAVWKNIADGIEFVFGEKENESLRRRVQEAKVYTDKANNSATLVGKIDETLINLKLSRGIVGLELITENENHTLYAVTVKKSAEIM